MSAYLLPLYALGSLWLLWACYVIVMGLRRAQLQGRLSLTAKVLGAPWLLLGIALDWLINWTIAAAFFREWPQGPKELVTQRLARYLKDEGQDYTTRIRKHRAGIICRHLLDVFDPNPQGHCQ